MTTYRLAVSHRAERDADVIYEWLAARDSHTSLLKAVPALAVGRISSVFPAPGKRADNRRDMGYKQGILPMQQAPK
jgi:hypothetical protein